MSALEIFRAFHTGSQAAQNPAEGYYAPLQQAMAEEVRTGQGYELIYNLAEMYGDGRLTHLHLLDAAAVVITWRQLVLRSERAAIPLHLPEGRRTVAVLPRVEAAWLRMPVRVDDKLGAALLNLCSYARTGGDLRQLGRVEKDDMAFRLEDEALMAEAAEQALEAAGADVLLPEPPQPLPEKAELKGMLEAFLREEDGKLQELAAAVDAQLAAALETLRDRVQEMEEKQKQLEHARALTEEADARLAELRRTLEQELQTYHRTRRLLESGGRQQHVAQTQNLRARPTGDA